MKSSRRWSLSPVLDIIRIVDDMSIELISVPVVALLSAGVFQIAFRRIDADHLRAGFGQRLARHARSTGHVEHPPMAIPAKPRRGLARSSLQRPMKASQASGSVQLCRDCADCMVLRPDPENEFDHGIRSFWYKGTSWSKGMSATRD